MSGATFFLFYKLITNSTGAPMRKKTATRKFGLPGGLCSTANSFYKNRQFITTLILTRKDGCVKKAILYVVNTDPPGLNEMQQSDIFFFLNKCNGDFLQ